MEADSATPSECPIIATGNGTPFFAFKILGFVLFAGLGLSAIVDGERVFAGLVMLVFGLAFVAFASRDARRVELYADGTLICHFHLRPSFATTAELVTGICVDTSDLLKEWSITVDGQRFKLSSGHSTRNLVDALRQFCPSILIVVTRDGAGE